VIGAKVRQPVCNGGFQQRADNRDKHDPQE
jgi:hypothetical protein